MSKIVTPLTVTRIKNAKPKKKEYNLADGEGLSLRIKPSGVKVWLFNYSRPHIKTRTNLSPGRYPDISLSEARAYRSEWKKLLANGIDPKDFIEDQKRQIEHERNATFLAVAEDWIKIKRTKVTERTGKKIWQLLEKHVLPFIGETPVKSLTPAEALKYIRPVSERGTKETARRMCNYINEVMRHALAAGLIEINYLTDINKLIDTPVTVSRPTIKPEELPELMRTLVSSGSSLIIRSLIEFQLHTMVRPIEAASARWVDISLDKKTWVISASDMKMNRSHTVPLSDQVVLLLKKLHSMNGHRTHVFPGKIQPKTHMSSAAANAALRRIGFKGRLTAHGMRALASTVLNEEGFDADIIEAALSHVDKNTTRRAYNRAAYIERRRVMMQWWSDYIDSAAMGNMSMAGIRNLRLV